MSGETQRPLIRGRQKVEARSFACLHAVHRAELHAALPPGGVAFYELVVP